jgi:hypothetical protein
MTIKLGSLFGRHHNASVTQSPAKPSGKIGNKTVSTGTAERAPAHRSGTSLFDRFARVLSGIFDKSDSLKARVRAPGNEDSNLFVAPEMKWSFYEKAGKSCLDILTDDRQIQRHAFEVMKWKLSNDPQFQKKDGTRNFTIKSVRIENGIQIRIQQPKNITPIGRLGSIFGGANPLEKYFDLIAATGLKTSEFGKYTENEYWINTLGCGMLEVDKNVGKIFPANGKIETFNEASLFAHFLIKAKKYSLECKLFEDLKYSPSLMIGQKAEKAKILMEMEPILLRALLDMIPNEFGPSDSSVRDYGVNGVGCALLCARNDPLGAAHLLLSSPRWNRVQGDKEDALAWQDQHESRPLLPHRDLVKSSLLKFLRTLPLEQAQKLMKDEFGIHTGDRQRTWIKEVSAELTQ